MTEEKKVHKLWEYMRKYWYIYLAGMLVLVAVDYLDLTVPEFTGEITDGLASHTMDSSDVAATILKMIGFAALTMAGRFTYRHFIIGTSRKIERSLQNDIFAKLETLSQRYYNENKTGDIMAYFTNDLDSLREAIGWCIISCIDTVVITFLVLYRMMVNVSVKLTLYIMIPMSIIAFFGFFISRAFGKRFEERHDAFAELSDIVQESISAERVIKAYVQEDYQAESFKKENNEYRQINMKLARLRAFAGPVLQVLVGVAYVIAIVFGGYYCLIGRITIGTFVTFSSYVGTLVYPMLAIGDSLIMVSQGMAAMRRINRVFEEPVEIKDSEHPDDVDNLTGEVKFDHVTFSYGPEFDNALTDLSFEIAKGETFAIMGRTGAGKTTVVNLMTRLFDVSDGAITFDGHNIKQIPLKVLRENIAYVPQDNFMFSETLQQNISFGKIDATLEEIIEACKIADVDDNFQDFPLKYDTMVGERGVTLSGGQKQRASIARAILKDSPILIMDDSLSAVDTDTEDNILHNLKNVRQDKTTIMIAHRVSTVQNADHILFLEEGKMAEYGTYDELMTLDGQFATMVKKQQLEAQLQSDIREVE